MRDLARVYGITKNGQIMQAESKTIPHNKLAKDLYKDYLETLSAKEKLVKGCGVDIYWPAVAAVVKNREDLIVLEVYIKEDENDFSLVFAPKTTTTAQLKKFKQRYAEVKGMVYYDESHMDDGNFESKKEYMHFSNMYNYLKQRINENEFEER